MVTLGAEPAVGSARVEASADERDPDIAPPAAGTVLVDTAATAAAAAAVAIAGTASVESLAVAGQVVFDTVGGFFPAELELPSDE